MTSKLTAKELFNVNEMVFVVTGGGSGLGEMMALALDANGAARVFVLGRRKSSLEKVATKAVNKTIIPIVCDVSSKDDLETAVKAVTRQTPFVNVVIACSGVTGPMTVPPPRKADQSLSSIQQDLWNTSFQQSQKAMDINVLGAFYTFVAFLHLLEAGNIHPSSRGKRDFIQSQFITISSLASFNRAENVGYAYMASKAGLVHLTKSLATGFARHGIRTNSIAPGLYLTEMTEYFAEGNDITKLGSLSKDYIPMTRSGSAEDIAGAVLFLTSRAGAFVNGTILVSDGGQLSIEPASY
ncbi:short chain dehydrogenase/reductase family [Penicillium cinerascens]|uniref:Short chain dehydrogenase/reductase family n=1 Tax=Penicillium cinerascens TaxID=70096 RepID=A0A9W9JKT6_9EURO|nr:short chain dehydrogenase/reductase family [Penicillium cinerascens]KAJ5198272.1 short chain dehydrogenase/reductase family [Penicillium cinerascens]